jgi:aldehyde:ferredoxin oxidoreductase
MERAIHTFYDMMGWDPETGAPTEEKLLELGIGWVSSQIGAAR